MHLFACEIRIYTDCGRLHLCTFMTSFVISNGIYAVVKSGRLIIIIIIIKEQIKVT